MVLFGKHTCTHLCDIFLKFVMKERTEDDYGRTNHDDRSDGQYVLKRDNMVGLDKTIEMIIGISTIFNVKDVS